MRQSARIISVKRVRYLADYKLRVWFNDGADHVIDFGPFLRQSLNPLIRKYFDVELFKNFTVAHGDLYWNDYDLCFPVADLYENRLLPRGAVRQSRARRAHTPRRDTRQPIRKRI